MPPYPPLQPLHPNSSLNAGKLAKLEQLSTEALLESLLRGQESCLKTRPEGTILDGRHRIHILRQRGVDVDDLAREIFVKDKRSDAKGTLLARRVVAWEISHVPSSARWRLAEG